jgi:protein TonB
VFNRLPESNARRQRRAGGLFVSTTLHLIIIALAVRATGLTAAAPPKIDDVGPIFIAPTPKPVAPTPPPPRRQYAGDPTLPTAPSEDQRIITIDTNILPGIPEPGAMDHLLDPKFDPTRVAGSRLPTAGPNVADGPPMLESQVEQPVVAIPGTATPRYPSMLQSAGLEGDVRAQFVVDTLGRVERGSFRALESSHDLFAAAVREALSRARFKPAEAGGRKVRQLVEQTFTFRITR